MSGESNFLDYEPLRNDGGGKTPSEDDSGFKKVRRQETEEEFTIRRKTVAPLTATTFTDVPLKRVTDDFKATTDPKAQDAPVVQETRPRTVTPTHLSFGQAVLKGGHAMSFAGLFLFTFLVFFRPYEWSPSLMWLNKSALITAIATLLFFLPTQMGLENRLTLRNTEVNMVLLLLLLGLLSLPQATDKLLAWNSFVEFLKVVVMFIVMVNVLRTPKRLKVLWLLILVASLTLSIKAILDYRAGRLALGGDRIAGAIGGLFENPNDLALHLVTFLPIVIALALAAKNPFSKLFYFFAALALVGGTVVTFSRGGFIGLLVVVGTFMWRMTKKNRIFVILAVGVLLVSFLILAPGAYRQRISTTGDDSAAARTGELKRSIYITLRHPVLGVGMDNFVVYSNTAHATHNAYTQVASEMGIPAAVFYIIFLVAAVRRVKRIPHPRDAEGKRKEYAYLAIGIYASLIGYMVTSFFASVAYLWYVYYLAAYAISVSRFWEASTLKESVSTPTVRVI